MAHLQKNGGPHEHEFVNTLIGLAVLPRPVWRRHGNVHTPAGRHRQQRLAECYCEHIDTESANSS